MGRISDPNGPHLITFTGAGGSGKSRLAVEVALRLDPTLTDGAYQVELGALDEPSLVGWALAALFGGRQASGQLIVETAVRFLGHKQLLLIVDNCEHVIGEAARLIELQIRGCPRLRIIATSREALRIRGEVLYLVPPLTIPPGDSLPHEQLASYETMRLFADRAVAVDSQFRLTAENGPVIPEICQWLDGPPLAIELAAARLDMLTIEQIASVLESRFELLTSGSRPSLSQHRSLLALVSWSYELLPSAERAVLRALSVFPGSFNLEGASEVALGFPGVLSASSRVRPPAGPESTTTLDDRVSRHHPTPVSFGLLDLLSNLVSKSLVLMDRRSSGPRFRLLESIREFGGQELRALGELDLAEHCLARWASALVSRAERSSGPSRRAN
jgi:predicted ATPase